MDKEIIKHNLIHLSGQVYSNPEERSGKNANGSGEWLIRKIKILFDNNQWIDLIFEDLELWNKYKKIPIGYFIEVSGLLKNSFNRKANQSKAQIEVLEVLYTCPIRTTAKNKFLMSKDTLQKRKLKIKGDK